MCHRRVEGTTGGYVVEVGDTRWCKFPLTRGRTIGAIDGGESSVEGEIMQGTETATTVLPVGAYMRKGGGGDETGRPLLKECSRRISEWRW